jgi:hypothetical protein
MKKLFILFSVISLFAACNNKKSEKENTGNTNQPATVGPASNNEDATLSGWLNGKMLSSSKQDSKTDMWDKLKLNADGSCTDKDNASAKWEIKNGEFVFHGPMDMKYKIEKKDDSTVIFKGSLGDDLYKLSPVK